MAQVAAMNGGMTSRQAAPMSLRVAPLGGRRSGVATGAAVRSPAGGAAAFVRPLPLPLPLLPGCGAAPREARCRVQSLEAPANAATASGSFASLMDETWSEGGEEVITLSETEDAEVDPSLMVENLGLCEATVVQLKKRGIHALFPIQKAVFEPITEGRDLIGRAKTGSGKTLAFALPVVEALMRESVDARARVNSPRAVVLAPTRELANQVAREFEWVCPKLKIVSVYGGAAISGQIKDLARGVDVVVGTPGRMIDLIERGNLRLGAVRYAILDEADQMLDMGFEEDMEKILGHVPDERQTLLFSATMPMWVKKVAKRFQKNPLMVDLVGSEDTGRLSDTIRLMIMQVDHTQKLNALMDAINLHGSTGGTIVFANTKHMVDSIAEHVNRTMPCVVLHGDIAQAQRDRGLKLFRAGQFQVLVATDVAARGLDIPSVDLVMHYDVPQDAESFLHRSGRTGRAGKTGTAAILFTAREARSVGQILRQTKTDRAEMHGPPPPEEVMTKASRNVLTSLDKVESGVIEFFEPVATQLMSSKDPTRVLAAALAQMSGFTQVPQPRSLLTYESGMQTLKLLGEGTGKGAPGRVDGFSSLGKAIKAMCKLAGLANFEFSIGKIRVLENQGGLDGAAFDMPVEKAQALIDASEHAKALGYTLTKATSISVDVQALMVGSTGAGRAGPPRADRWGGSQGGSFRSGGRGGGGGRGGRGSRDDSRGGRGSREDSWGSRGGSRRQDDGWSRGGGGGSRSSSSFGSRRDGAARESGGWGSGGGSSGGGWEKDASYFEPGFGSGGASTRRR